MIELQQNRYLWVHFAGLAFVPLLLDICLAGFASAGPALPFGGQFWAIALIGIPPALAMQWLKPFYVFSLPPSALRPAVLSEDQRRCLTIFKSWQIKALAVVVAVISLWLLAQIYAMSPQISPLLTPRAGLICGALAFFMASTLMQISVSAGRALLIGPTALKRVAAVEKSAIARDFLILGIRVNKLLPDSLLDDAKDATEQKQSIRANKPVATTQIRPKSAPDSKPPVKASESEALQADGPVTDKPVTDGAATAKLSEDEKTDTKETNEKETGNTTAPVSDAEQPTKSLATPESEPTESTAAAKTSEELEVVIPERLPPEDSRNL